MITSPFLMIPVMTPFGLLYIQRAEGRVWKRAGLLLGLVLVIWALGL